MDVNMITDLVGKEVVVIKRDGFQKFGILKGLADHFLVLKFLDGKEEIISFEAIDSIKENLRGGRA